MAASTTPKQVRELLNDWFSNNTFVPDWVPKKIQHPASAYVLAGLIQTVAIFATMGLIFFVTDFTFRGAFILLGVIGVALTLGAGPGLLASLVGATLLDLLLVPPYFTLTGKKGADFLNVFFYFVVCLATNLASSHAQKVRQPPKV